MITKKQANLEEREVSLLIVAYKLVSGIVEIFLGLGIMFYGRQIYEVYRNFRAQELLEDPHDLVVKTIENITPFIIRHKIYIIAFLLMIGVAKTVSAIGILKRRHWGLDLMVGMIVLLLPFDLYSFAAKPSWLKFLYIAVNILIALFLMKFKPRLFLHRLNRYFQKEIP